MPISPVLASILLAGRFWLLLENVILNSSKPAESLSQKSTSFEPVLSFSVLIRHNLTWTGKNQCTLSSMAENPMRLKQNHQLASSQINLLLSTM